MKQSHPQDTHVFDDGTKIRMLGNAILVRIDETQDRTSSGLIYYPEGAMEHVLNTGTILAFGTMATDRGERLPLPGLEVGLKCVFVRFLAEQESNKQIRERVAPDCIRLRCADILLVYPESEHHRVLK